MGSVTFLTARRMHLAREGEVLWLKYSTIQIFEVKRKIPE
jgi:hypothetical protein